MARGYFGGGQVYEDPPPRHRLHLPSPSVWVGPGPALPAGQRAAAGDVWEMQSESEREKAMSVCNTCQHEGKGYHDCVAVLLHRAHGIYERELRVTRNVQARVERAERFIKMVQEHKGESDAWDAANQALSEVLAGTTPACPACGGCR